MGPISSTMRQYLFSRPRAAKVSIKQRSHKAKLTGGIFPGNEGLKPRYVTKYCMFQMGILAAFVRRTLNSRFLACLAFELYF